MCERGGRKFDSRITAWLKNGLMLQKFFKFLASKLTIIILLMSISIIKSKGIVPKKSTNIFHIIFLKTPNKRKGKNISLFSNLFFVAKNNKM